MTVDSLRLVHVPGGKTVEEDASQGVDALCNFNEA